MGGFITTFGRYSAYYGDYEWDYIKDGKSKEYYEKATIPVTIKDRLTKEEEDVEMPVLALIDLKLKKKYYGYTHKNGHPFRDWFVTYLLEKKNYKGFLCHIKHSSFRQDSEVTYYLTSKVGEDRVVLVNDKKKAHAIYSLEDLQWLEKHHLEWNLMEH